MAKRLSWAVRIERAEKRGKFTEQEVGYAQSWHTCAVGEKKGFSKDAEWVGSSDDELGSLGMDFMYAVREQDLAEARRLYAEIMALPA